ncbi:MAG: hypothetical protein K8I30_14690, partial [Anaerolineae bacterium]|nr:hypothetical protein [Anaerolineae bacterium]
RLWLQDYPAEIRAKVPPLTLAEKRQRGVVGVLVVAVFVLPVLWSLSQLEAANGGSLPYLTAFVHAFLVLNIGNLFDAVVIDFLIIAVFKPRFVVLAGAEDMTHLFRDWNKHIGDYLKGIIFCAIMALVIALIAVVL